jgi:hypothetical protein
MKARTLYGWLFGMVLAVASAASGCAQDSINAPPPTSPSDAGRATAPAPNVSAAPQTAPAAPATPAKQGDQSSPPRITLSSWAQEIQKLVQAGVEERVITTYITNSAGMFNLTADQIISLKNVGVSPKTLSVMIQHDQQLFSSGVFMTAPAEPPANQIATFATPGASPIVANDDSWAQELVLPEDFYYAPEQPEGIGPVRAPYAVKLNDPIIMLRLPTFTVPCW